jgi:hypothetical protein
MSRLICFLAYKKNASTTIIFLNELLALSFLLSICAVLSRELTAKNIYPAVDFLDLTSTML